MRYKVVIKTIYNSKLHGGDPCNDGHYLILETFDYINSANYTETDSESDSDSEDSEESETNILTVCKSYDKMYKEMFSDISNRSRYRLNSHCIRNYLKIMKFEIKPEIGECIYLATGEYVVILKTYWIRIFQRIWKRMYANKQKAIKQRMIPKNIFFWQSRGYWPRECKFPKGMKC